MFAKAVMSGDPEHRAILRSSARDYLTSQHPLPKVRARRGESDAAALQAMAALGWIGLLAEADSEFQPQDLVALHRELGRAALPEPMIGSGVISAAILGALNDPDLAEVLAGRLVVATAWQGGAEGRSAADCGMRLKDGRLSGKAEHVIWHKDTQQILIGAATVADEIALVKLSADHPGLSLQHGRAIDGQPVATLTLGDVEIPTGAILMQDGKALLDHAIDLGRLAVSAELIGAAERLFEMTLEHVKTRSQFGKLIGSYQGVQHILADLFVEVEHANSVVSHAGRSMGAAPAERARRIAGCKSRCSDVAFETARTAIQLHGAIGYTDEYDASHFVKRIVHYMTWLGNGARQRRFLTEELAQTHPALPQTN